MFASGPEFVLRESKFWGNMLVFYVIALKIEIIQAHLELSQECLNILPKNRCFCPKFVPRGSKFSSGACFLWYYLRTGNNSGHFVVIGVKTGQIFGPRVSILGEE